MCYLFVGKGHYGDVFLAKAFGIVESEPESLVSFKALLSREEAHQFDFRRELEMFARLNHDSITRLLGISRETEPFFLIFEYLEWVPYNIFPLRSYLANLFKFFQNSIFSQR
jgi:serine/threonine protein kinase